MEETQPASDSFPQPDSTQPAPESVPVEPVPAAAPQSEGTPTPGLALAEIKDPSAEIKDAEKDAPAEIKDAPAENKDAPIELTDAPVKDAPTSINAAADIKDGTADASEGGVTATSPQSEQDVPADEATKATLESVCKICGTAVAPDQDTCAACGNSQRATEPAKPATRPKQPVGMASVQPRGRMSGSAFACFKPSSAATRLELARKLGKQRLAERLAKPIPQGPVEEKEQRAPADGFGTWICASCSRRNLPQISHCEVCHTSRTVTGARTNEIVVLKFVRLLANVGDAREAWTSHVANRLLLEFELVVNRTRSFRLVEIDVSFEPISGSAAEWDFRGNRDSGRLVFYEDKNKAVGILFGKTDDKKGSIVLRAVQEEGPCRCGKNQTPCPTCNALSETASAVVSAIQAAGWWSRTVEKLVENLAGEDLCCAVPNPFLYLRTLPKPLPGKVEATSIPEKHTTRFCSLPGPLAQRRKEVVLDLGSRGLSAEEISSVTGFDLAMINPLMSVVVLKPQSSLDVADARKLLLPKSESMRDLIGFFDVPENERKYVPIAIPPPSVRKFSPPPPPATPAVSVHGPSGETSAAPQTPARRQAPPPPAFPRASTGIGGSALASLQKIPLSPASRKDVVDRSFASTPPVSHVKSNIPLDEKKLSEGSIHVQASILNAYFNELFKRKPTTWASEIASTDLLFALAKPGSRLAEAILYGERDPMLHELVPKHPRRQNWIPFVLPLFLNSDAGKGKQDGEIECEECEENAATVRCQYQCGVFCRTCAQIVHSKGRRKEHPLDDLPPMLPRAPSVVPANARSHLNLEQSAQYMSCLVADFSFHNEKTEEFSSLLAEFQTAIESLGWTDANAAKARGMFISLLKKLQTESKQLRNQMAEDDGPKWDNLVALINVIEEFCLYSPYFGLGARPAPNTIGLHLNETGCADKELFALVDDLLEKRLNVNDENFLMGIPEEASEQYKRRQKTLASGLALCKAAGAWCAALESEVAKEVGENEENLSDNYGKAVTILVAQIAQRPRGKKSGGDKRQASTAFISAVVECRQNRVKKDDLKAKKDQKKGQDDPNQWATVHGEAVQSQLKAAQNTLSSLLAHFPKVIDSAKAFSGQLERIAQGGEEKEKESKQHQKGADRMQSLDDASQDVRNLSNAVLSRAKNFAAELQSELCNPLLALQKDHAQEMSVLSRRLAQAQHDIDANKQRLRSYREVALKHFQELVRAYYASREKESADKLLAAKNACLISFADYEKKLFESENTIEPEIRKAQQAALAEMRALERKRILILKGYFKRYLQSFERFTSAYPAAAELDKKVDSIDADLDLLAFSKENEEQESRDEILPFESTQILTNSWVESLPEQSLGRSASSIDFSRGPQPVQYDELGLPIKEGNLPKLGGIVKSWKQRYVVLQKKKIYYYKAANKKQLQGELDVDGGAVFSWSDDFTVSGKKGELVFGFRPPNQTRVFAFQAPDMQEKQLWIQALEMHGATFSGLADNLELSDRATFDTGQEGKQDLNSFLQANSLLIARVTLPEGFDAKMGTFAAEAGDTFGFMKTRLVEKHGGGATPDTFQLLYEATVLDDVTVCQSKFQGQVALTLQRA